MRLTSRASASYSNPFIRGAQVLKTTTLTVWDRNLQLAVYSMIIYVPWAIWESPGDPFHGWSPITLMVALLGALGGILVAMVIKYADGLAKRAAADAEFNGSGRSVQKMALELYRAQGGSESLRRSPLVGQNLGVG